MLDIFFSNEDDEILEIPYVPYDFLIETVSNNGTFETSEGKTLTLKGLLGLRSFTLDSFFAKESYGWMGSEDMLADECIEYIENNRLKILRAIVCDGSETLCNMQCTIDNFSYSKKQNKDVDYSLSVTEYIDPLEVV